MASLYDRFVLPWVINCACGAPSIAHQRAKVVPEAQGRVLELGMGSGLNLPFYDAGKVTHVEGLEPSPELRKMAEGKGAGLDLAITDGRAEALPFESASFDTVVCTYTLCSVQDPAAALAESRRVLKPGGRLMFCEHGAAPDLNVEVWQRRIEPLWKVIAGGCHLTRPVAKAITAAGFHIERHDQMYVPDTPRWAAWTEWGVAAPA
jgi:ubiquinone/menaquinone biosynthesis C-methylase UbiE